MFRSPLLDVRKQNKSIINLVFYNRLTSFNGVFSVKSCCLKNDVFVTETLTVKDDKRQSPLFFNLSLPAIRCFSNLFFNLKHLKQKFQSTIFKAKITVTTMFMGPLSRVTETVNIIRYVVMSVEYGTRVCTQPFDCYAIKSQRFAKRVLT